MRKGKKIGRYDADKHRAGGGSNDATGDDAFGRLFAAVNADIDAALEKSEMASQEKNRTAAVAVNAEIRRTNARLLVEVPELLRLAGSSACPLLPVG